MSATDLLWWALAIFALCCAVLVAFLVVWFISDVLRGKV